MKISFYTLAAISAGALAGALWAAVPDGAPSPRALTREERLEVARAREALAIFAAAARCSGGRCGDDGGFGEAVADEALYQLTNPDREFRDDCSGFASAVFTALGVPMDGVVVSLWDHATYLDALHWEERPKVGDLVFFEKTYDRDLDDLTHIGVVVAVDPEGTVTFAHAGTSSGRKLGKLNVFEPSVHKRDGRVINDYLRNPERWDRPGTRYLAGDLWMAFATVNPDLDWKTSPPPP